MGRDLFFNNAIYRHEIERCDKELQKYVKWSLLEEMMKPEKESNMGCSWLSQPANFAVQIALVKVWKSLGIEPSAIIGHSTGEVAASYVAGIYSFEDAVKIIFHRSNLQEETNGTGSMAAVGIPVNEAEKLIEPFGSKLDIAAVNAQNSVTISGDENALIQLQSSLSEDIFFKKLNVSIPFHSQYMLPIKDRIHTVLQSIQAQEAITPFYSTVYGNRVSGQILDANYWWKNIRQPVLFHKALSQVIEDGYEDFLEIGPHPVLSRSIMDTKNEEKITGIISHSLNRNTTDNITILDNLFKIYFEGYSINLDHFFPKPGSFVKLPLYPWQYSEYWHESDYSKERRVNSMKNPLLGTSVNSSVPIWLNDINLDTYPYLMDHKIQGNIVFPAAGYIEIMFEAISERTGQTAFILEDVNFVKAAFPSENDMIRFQTIINEETSSISIYSFLSSDVKNSVMVSNGCVQMCTVDSPRISSVQVKKDMKKLSKTEIYQVLNSLGYNYDTFFQGLNTVWISPEEIVADIEITAPIDQIEGYKIFPAVLDCCFQACILTDFQNIGTDKENIKMPTGLKRIFLRRKIDRIMRVSVTRVLTRSSEFVYDIELYSEKGELIASIEKFTVRNISADFLVPSQNEIDKWLYMKSWIQKDNNQKYSKKEGSWIIFKDNSSLGNEVGAQLEKLGKKVAYITYPGNTNNELSIDYNDRAKLQKILSKINSEGNVEGILHLWNLNSDVSDNLTIDHIEEYKKTGLLSLISIIQTLKEVDIKLKVWIVTRNSQEVDNYINKSLSVAQSAVWGLGRIIGYQEHVDLWGGLIDLDEKHDSDNSKYIVNEILTDDKDDQIAIRDGKRFVFRVEQAKITTKSLPIHLRSDASYLVIGGFGAIGKIMIEWLIKHSARHIIVSSQKDLPNESEWDSMPMDESTLKRIECIKEWRRKGVSVHLVNIDLNSENDIEPLISNIENRLNIPIKGVMFSAGVVEDKLITKIDESSFSRVYDVKAKGAWKLHQCLQDKELDFFVLFSSIASILSSEGQSNYASGNCFLDALASYRRSKGLPALSIGWGAWNIGMIKDLGLEKVYKAKGIELISPLSGMQVIDRVLGLDLAYTGAVPADWHLVLKSLANNDPEYLKGLADYSTIDDTDTFFLDKYCSLEENEKQGFVTDTVKGILSGILRLNITLIDKDLSLMNYGIDSIMSMELRNQISNIMGVNIPIVDILNNKSIEDLIQLIQGKCDVIVETNTLDSLITDISEEDLLDTLSELENSTDNEL